MDEEPVVVGVDEGEPHRELLRWAATEAGHRARPLVVCHVCEWWSGPQPPVAVPLPDGTGPRSGPERAVAAAVDAVRAEFPDLPVSGVLGGGSPSRTLLAMPASMLVVGARGLGGFPGLLMGSVAGQVAEHGRGPVAVVRPARSGAADVVVGVDGSAQSGRALAVALDEARRTGGRLVALHAYQLPPATAAYGLNPGSDVAGHHWLAERTLAEALGDVEAEHPDVKIERRVDHGPVARVLLAAAEGAAVLVVGSRGRGGFAGLVMGSVSQQVLRHATGPVVVVH